MRFIAVTIVLFLIQTTGVSQALPSVIMPNPEPAKIASYGKYEISNYTGKPSISVPLYNIQTTRLQLPISLTYEATGVKINDIASNVGLGFFLDGGGIITRAIIGLPDDYTEGYLSYTPAPSDFSNRAYLYDLSYKQKYDLEPDKYYYNFNGISGEFSFDEQKNVFNMGINGLVITRTTEGFTITDENGNVYEFTKKEFTTVEVDLDVVVQVNSATSWWLTKITSADKSDVIDLEYETDFQEVEQNQSFMQTYGRAVYYVPGDPTGHSEGRMYATEVDVVEASSSFQKRTWSAERLSCIKFRNGRVKFINIKDRQDVISSTRLDRIEIYSKINDVEYTKVKTIKLTTDYFHYTGPVEYNSIFYSATIGKHRLKLQSIEEFDADDRFINSHSFEYDMSSEIPYRGSLSCDYWGYNNGAYINNRAATLIPAQRTEDNKYNIGGADREPNEQAMKAGVLTKITYPTGGFTKFNWEAHRYLQSNQTVQDKRAFCQAYGNNAANVPEPYKTLSFELTEGQPVFINSYINYVAPTEPYDDPDLESIAQDTYPYVSLLNEITGSEIYITRYSGGIPNRALTIDLPAGKYKIISACYANSVNAFTSIEVLYKKTINAPDIRLAGGLRIKSIDNYSTQDKVSNSETYKYGTDENGYGMLSMPATMMNTLSYNKQYSYVLTLSKLTSLKKTYRSEPVASLSLSGGSSVVYPVVTKYIGDSQNNIGKTIYRHHHESDVVFTSYPSGTNEEYVITRYPWRTGYLTDLEEYKRENNIYTLVKHTHNDYTELGLKHFQVTRSGFIASVMPMVNGSMGYESNVFFLEDYYRTSYPVPRGISQLTSSSVKEYSPSGACITTTTNYTYDPIYNKFLATQTSRNSAGEDVKVVNKYPFDKEQLLDVNVTNKSALDEMVKRNMISQIVETQTFKGATRVERTRTNFKVLDASQTNPDTIVRPQNVERQILASPSEVVYRQLKYDRNGNILEQAKDSDISNVYLWGYGSSYPLADIKNSTLSNVLSALGFTQSQLETNAMATVPSADYLTRVNNLRNSLPNALIATYTYKPLVGITSATAANGNIIYYEYDPSGRLRYIRDKDNNIVRSFEYNYQIK